MATMITIIIIEIILFVFLSKKFIISHLFLIMLSRMYSVSFYSILFTLFLQELLPLCLSPGNIDDPGLICQGTSVQIIE